MGHEMGHAVNRKKSYKKKQWRPPGKKKKRGKNLSPKNRKACHIVNTALLKSVAEIGTHSAVKSAQRKTLHEFTSQITQKNAENQHKYSDERNVAYGHICHSARSEDQQHPCQGSDEQPPK
jgi:hypothetical protein